MRVIRARVALRVAHADGGDEVLTFRQIAEQSSRFAHLLQAEGVGAGERVAIMLEPGEAYYVALFGCMKAGLRGRSAVHRLRPGWPAPAH